MAHAVYSYELLQDSEDTPIEEKELTTLMIKILSHFAFFTLHSTVFNES